MSTFNLVETDQLITGAVGEKVATVTSSSSVTYDYRTAGVFIHNVATTSNWVANIINVPNEINKAYTITIICTSGSSAFGPSSYTLNGSALSGVSFTSGSLSGDAANKTKIMTITFIRKSDNTVLAIGNGAVL